MGGGEAGQVELDLAVQNLAADELNFLNAARLALLVVDELLSRGPGLIRLKELQNKLIRLLLDFLGFALRQVMVLLNQLGRGTDRFHFQAAAQIT